MTFQALPEDQWPGLPKWPGVFITGKSVTPEQAKEIIFRTDTNVQGGPTDYLSGNDRNFEARVKREFGWLPLIERENQFWKLSDIKDEDERARQRDLLLPPETGLNTLWELHDAWREEMRIVETEYVYNSYLSSAYIGGPCGWVSVNGNVHFEGHNYGKWPSVEAIVKDWTALVEAFPYLDLVCTLFSGESCEDHARPVCSIVVRDGKVIVCEPDMSLHDKNPEPPRDPMESMAPFLLGLQTGTYSYERGWPTGWLEEFGAKSQAAMRKVAPFLYA